MQETDDHLAEIEPIELIDKTLFYTPSMAANDHSSGQIYQSLGDSSSSVNHSSFTTSSGYVSKSLPSISQSSKSLPVSPDTAKHAVSFERSTGYWSVGTDKENAKKYKRPVGTGPRVCLFKEPGEIVHKIGEKMSTSSGLVLQSKVHKKPMSGIHWSPASPELAAYKSPQSADNFYFSRENVIKKIEAITPIVPPLNLEDMNNNDNGVEKTKGKSDKDQIQDTGNLDAAEKVDSADREVEDVMSQNSQQTSHMPTLTFEQLVTSFSSAEEATEDRDIINRSMESLQFQQDDSDGPHFEADPNDDKVPRSLYIGDESLLDGLEVGDTVTRPLMELQPVKYDDSDFENTLTLGASATIAASGGLAGSNHVTSDTYMGQITKPAHQSALPLNNDVQNLQRDNGSKSSTLGKAYKAADNEQQGKLQLNQGSCKEQNVALKPLSQLVYGDQRYLKQNTEYKNITARIQEPLSQPSSGNVPVDGKQDFPEDPLSSISHKQASISQEVDAAPSHSSNQSESSIHGAAVDTTATHDISISSSVYGYLGKVSKPQVLARDVANMKTSSPMIDRAKIREYLMKGAKEIESMEQVRGHLQHMLHLTDNIMPDKNNYDQSKDDILSDNGDDEENSASLFSGFKSNGGKNFSMLPTHLESLLGLGAFHSSHGKGDIHSSTSLYAENQALKEALEREKFRRKHLEKQIASCQSQTLELQQQLAVAVSTDRKKDTMIEQLDKALAKVVEGWKKRDVENKEVVQQIQQENDTLSSRAQHQKEMLMRLEKELSEVVEKLTQEQKRAKQTEEEKAQQMKEQQEEREHTLRMLELNEERILSLTQERDQLTTTKDRLQGQLLDLRQTLDDERESWEEKEKEYLQKIDEITANHLKAIEQEKKKTAMTMQTLEDTENVLAAAHAEISNLSMQVDTVTREKESLKVEIGIQEARNDNSRRKLEADLRADLERQISENMSEAHKRQAASEDEIRERHRRQVKELNSQHNTEMEELRRQFQEDARRREDKMAQQSIDFEEKLTEATQDMESLKAQVKKLEVQRQEMTSKLQSMMQAHCSEALRLLQLSSVTSHSRQGSLFTTSPSKPSISSFGDSNYPVTMATATETSWSTVPTMSTMPTMHHQKQSDGIPASQTSTQKLEITNGEHFHGLFDGSYKNSVGSNEPLMLQNTNVAKNQAFTSFAKDTGNKDSPKTREYPTHSQYQNRGPDSPRTPPTFNKATPTSTLAHPTATHRPLPTYGFSYSNAAYAYQAPPTAISGANQMRSPKLSLLSNHTTSPAHNYTNQEVTILSSGPLDTSNQTDKLSLHLENSPPQSHMPPPMFTSSPPRSLEKLAQLAKLHATQQTSHTYQLVGHIHPQSSHTHNTLNHTPSDTSHLYNLPGHTSQQLQSAFQQTNHAYKEPKHSFYQTAHIHPQPSSTHSQPSSTHQWNLPHQASSTHSQPSSTHQWNLPHQASSTHQASHTHHSNHALQESNSSQSFLERLVKSEDSRRFTVMDPDVESFHALPEDTTLESNMEEINWESEKEQSNGIGYNQRSDDGNMSDFSEKFQEHQSRQAELQSYIRMLLHRSPGETGDISQNRTASQEDEPTHDTSHGGIYSPVRIPQPGPVVMSGQGQHLGHSEVMQGQGNQEVKQPAFMHTVIAKEKQPGVLSPKQVGEIARLLGQYRQNPQEGKEKAEPPVNELLTYLRDLAPSRGSSTSSPDHTPPRTVIHKKLSLDNKDVPGNDKVKRNLENIFQSATNKDQKSKQELPPQITTRSNVMKQQGPPGARKQTTKQVQKVVKPSENKEEKKLPQKDSKKAKVWK